MEHEKCQEVVGKFRNIKNLTENVEKLTGNVGLYRKCWGVKCQEILGSLGPYGREMLGYGWEKFRNVGILTGNNWEMLGYKWGSDTSEMSGYVRKCENTL